MGFILISQLGGSNEHPSIVCFGYYRKYTHLLWSTDKLDIYHVYIYEIYGILHAKYSYQETIYYQSHIKP